jgi:NADH dehydrogenase
MDTPKDMETRQIEPRPKIVVLGGGFAGLEVTRRLRRVPVDILLIDRTNHHLFQPLLYQVASAALSPADIARPLRQILHRQKNATVVMGEVVSLDPENSRIHLATGESVGYDKLILAPGARHSYFAHPEWEPLAPGIKTLEDALDIRGRLLQSFESAERALLGDPNADVSAQRTFVVVGAGPTGVEMAGAIAEIAHITLHKNFRRLDPADSRVLLVEASSKVLPPYPDDLGESAHRQLTDLGVEVHLETRVSSITADGVTLELPDGKTLEVASCNVVWAAGNQAPPLLRDLAAAKGERAETVTFDRQGRVEVAADLSVPEFPDVYVLGDAAHVEQDGSVVPGVAQAALQQGRYMARMLAASLSAERGTNAQRFVRPDGWPPFRYKDPGSMATIGRARAVAWIGRLHLTGLVAWLAWSLLHVAFLVGFRNRTRVMIEWAFWYFTGRRGARLLFRPIRRAQPEAASAQEPAAKNN